MGAQAVSKVCPSPINTQTFLKDNVTQSIIFHCTDLYPELFGYSDSCSILHIRPICEAVI